MMLTRLFFDHPRSMGETYLGHQRMAFRFGATMVAAGVAVLIHGLIPGLFTGTGSRTVSRLHEQMLGNRRLMAATGSALQRTT